MKNRTLTDLLPKYKNCTDRGVTFINGSDKENYLSYNDLYYNALSTLQILKSMNIQPHDEVVIQIDDSESFLTLFWACLLGKIIPVPLTTGNSDEHRLKLLKVWNTLNNPFLVTEEKHFKKQESFFKEKLKSNNEKKFFFTKDVIKPYVEGSNLKELEALVTKAKVDDIAYIQFSSGSTGNPKGVTLTHRNLLTNLKGIVSSANMDDKDSFFSWMPLTHDMGMIGFHLVPFFLKINQYIMPTTLFIRRPFIWLDRANHYRATILSSPNFGYKYFLKFFEKMDTSSWDLSCIRLIFNGAEPISSELCRAFLDTLEPFGLKREAMFTVYGLAEASLAVAFPPLGETYKSTFVNRRKLLSGEPVAFCDKDNKDAMEFVIEGKAVEGCHMRIVDNSGQQVEDNTIGYIEIGGDNVTSGYYNNEEATKEIISSEGWLNTGDLGFMKDGSLVVTGRAKDVIFSGGQNFYAHDIERLAEKVEGVELGTIAAAGLFDSKKGDDRLILFILYKSSDLTSFVKIANELKRVVNIEAGLKVDSVVPIKRVPKTTSGKVQRYKLITQFANNDFDEIINKIESLSALGIDDSKNESLISERDKKAITQIILKELKLVLGYAVTELDRSLMEQGLSSLKMPLLKSALEQAFKIDIPVSVAFDYPTVKGISEYISGRLSSSVLANNYFTNIEHENKSSKKVNEDIAIIGIGCRFPGGADTPESFFSNLINGNDAITEIPKERWDSDEYYHPEDGLPGKSYSKEGGFIDGVDQFDPIFFGITPKETLEMDPQQRLLLEVSWEAMENAGLNMDSLEKDRVGFFTGISSQDYLEHTLPSKEKIENHTFTGSMLSVASGRVSFFNGFHGPTMSIDTACSSSLVAVNQALLNLKLNKCDMALAGGVNLILSPRGHIGLSRLNALSPDGRCKSFDDSANGYVRSEGCGVVVLKRYSDAVRDNDNIIALISGSAINHDGKSSGLTVPNGVAQERVIDEALRDAAISPTDIDYIEAHGSATKLGDPQELNALANVFRAREGSKVKVGSVKANIGHTESAAGIAGLIKGALSLKNGVIPGQIHLDKPNSLIDWDKIPLEVSAEHIIYPSNSKTRYIGVSSFGMSGTNAHLILKEAPLPSRSLSKKEIGLKLLTISAKREDTLLKMIEEYCDYLEKTEEDIRDICLTSNNSRTLFSNRFACTGNTKEDFINNLNKVVKSPFLLKNSPTNNNLVFMFTGQGAQYKGMGKELYENFKVFKDELKRCDRLFSNYLDRSICELLYSESLPASLLLEAKYCQPVIFSFQYALYKLWSSWGVEPELVIGHSIGEYCAAYAAGIFNLEDAVKLVYARGALMDSLPRDGAMTVIMESEETIKSLPGSNELDIAAVNGQRNITLSGRTELIERIEKAAKKRGISTVRLDVSHAFHSRMLKPILDRFKSIASEVRYNLPKLDVISCISGTKVTKDEMSNPDYWTSQIVETVHFTRVLDMVRMEGQSLFVEVGGHPVLSGITGQYLDELALNCIPSARKKMRADETILSGLAALYTNGININWENYLMGKVYSKVALPNYKFNKKSYWVNKIVQDNGNFTGKPQLEAPQTIVQPPQNITKTALKEVVNILKESIYNVTGLDPEDIGSDTNLFTIGLDSLMLVQFRKAIISRFKIEISFEKFIKELMSIEKIAAYITPILNEKETIEQNEKASKVEQSASPSLSGDNITNIDQRLAVKHDLITKYHEFMSKQLDSLNNLDSSLELKQELPQVLSTIRRSKKRIERPKINIRAMKFEPEKFTPQQDVFINSFIKKFNAKTARSKDYAQKHRATLSDWINTLNYQTSLKQLIYPIVSAESEGAVFKDIDGNNYLDLAIGYGVSYFGHKPAFIQEALQNQLSKGIELGPQTDLAGDVSNLISKIAGVERVSFCNTGSEAVMNAIRIARTVTKRDKIVLFSTSYHGNGDNVLVMTDEEGTFPISPGITEGMVEDIIALDYGTDESLEQIKAMGSELAGVLVEPVQTRRPGFQPREFLHKLRGITEESGTALIFDEVVTGFRIHPGGAQHHFGIKADLVTYGKLIGGGMPIGVVAGKSKFLDAVDGGSWSYDSGSSPDKDVTFFAGTFSKHPLALAAAKAILEKLENEGPQLQEDVNKLTAHFTHSINDYFKVENVPLKVSYFASQFKFDITPRKGCSISAFEYNLFFLYLMFKGVYTWEKRICFFSTAHNYEDVDKLIAIIKNSIEELRQGGFAFGSDDKNGGPGQGKLPMSSVQKRLYALSKLDGGDLPYHITNSMLIEGKLDTQKLESCIKKLMDRHESFRTSFSVEGSSFYQIIHDSLEPHICYKKISEERIDEEVKEFVTTFELAEAPLMRVLVGEISQERHLLVLDWHHSIIDGYSANVLAGELMELYKGVTLAPPSRQYRDYVSWEMNYISSELFQEQRDYWKAQFADKPALVELPVDYSRPAIRTFEGNTLNYIIDKEMTNKLKNLAKKSGKTLFNLLLAAYNILLYKLSGQNDITVGTPVAVRERGDFEQAIGMFTNTLVLRNYLEGSKSFSNFLDEVQNNFFTGYVNKEYPYENLVRDVGVKNSGSRNPLFDIMFVYENGNDRVFRIADLTFENYHVDFNSAMFDLNFEVIEEREHLNLSINFDSNIYKEETVKRWKVYFEKILKIAVLNPEIKIKDIDMLSSNEREQILKQFNNCESSFFNDKSYIDYFEQNAVDSPDRIAAVHNGREITYKKLNETANRVAHFLGEKGVKEGEVVALYFSRGLEMLTTMLAVMKAGAAFIAIDVDFPRERVKGILNDCGAVTLLTEPEWIDVVHELQDSLASLENILSIEGVEEIEKILADHPSDNPGISPDGDSLAYLIYTSGTTGKPKGAMLHYKGLLNHLIANRDFLELSSEDRFAQTASTGFDISIWQFLIMPFVGGTVEIIDKELILDSKRLIERVEKGKLTVLQLVPSLIKELLKVIDEEKKAQMAGLRWLIPTGEALPVHLASLWYKNFPHIMLVNAYGPAETSDDVTLHIVKQDELKRSSSIPIGKPLPNFHVYIINDSNGLCPIGVPGEIAVAGVGVGMGYLNDKERTAKSFIPNPFLDELANPEQYKTVYKTGDIGYYRPDGVIEILGRRDHQVKLRGSRIELGEIEHQLAGHNSISEALVILRQDSSKGDYLHGFYVSENEIDSGELKLYLADRLPGYMIPSYFNRLDAIPLTANGKTDRSALEAIEARRDSDEEYVEPGNNIEAAIASVWAEVLQLERVSTQDNFFDVGGHSLALIGIQSRLEEELGQNIAITTMFRYPTVSSLAQYLSEGGMEDTISDEDMEESVNMMEETFALMGEDE